MVVSVMATPLLMMLCTVTLLSVPLPSNLSVAALVLPPLLVLALRERMP